jgi:hypothetical protein
MQQVQRQAVTGIVAGFAGSSMMAVTLWLEHRLRADVEIVDYDASPHVVAAASTVLRYRPRTRTGERALFVAVHWGYGSLVGDAYLLARRLTRDPRRATLVYLAGCQTMAWTLFPLLGDTPVPWRWRRDLLVSSVVQHAVYAVVVASIVEVSSGGPGTARPAGTSGGSARRWRVRSRPPKPGT